MRADYIIIYFKRGAHLSSSPWSGELDGAKRIAHAGLVRRGADECQIRANTLDGPLVWQGRRGADATSFRADDVFRDE